MKITKIVLNKCTRFGLLGIDTLTYTPESPYQLVLGKNGIGKSSLLNELSPLPPDSSDLLEGGYKTIYIEHRGHRYKLHYSLNKKIDCSFIRDEKELNDGGTIKAQKELIWQHFHYNTDIHDVLVGFQLLTNMSPATRREWFVKMSKSDMNFALNLYNSLRSAERDIRGAIKLNNQRLVAEKAKLPSAEDITFAKQTSERLKTELNHLLPFTEQNLEDYSSQILTIANTIDENARQLINLRLTTYQGENNLNTLKELFYSLEHQDVQCRQDYKKAVNEIAELQDILNKNKALQDRPLNVIDNEIQTCQSLINRNLELRDSIGIHVGDNPIEQLQSFGQVFFDLKEILMILPINELDEVQVYQYDRRLYESVRKVYEDLTHEIYQLRNKIDYHEKLLENIKRVHDVNCPQCQYSFKPGVDCQEEARLTKLLQELRQTLQQRELKASQFKKEVDDNMYYFGLLKKIRLLADNNPILSPMFKYLTDHTDTLYSNPKQLIPMLEEYRHGLEVKLELNRQEELFKKLQEERVRRLAAEGTDTEYVVNKIASLEKYLNDLVERGKSIAKEISEINEVVSGINDKNRLQERLEGLLEDYRRYTYQQVKYRNNEVLKSLISQRQIELANSERIVTNLNQSETIIKQLEDANASMQKEQDALKVLIKLLSPQDGLIAESLMGFLNQFLNEMSNVIDNIWSYSMRPYMDISDEGIELDYKFKVDIEGVEKPAKDVSVLSRGQKEVIDFVFKLIFMQHLDLQDFPLFMDEIGGSFDDRHRDKLYHYVKQLVESEQVQQVFIISHIASSHNALIDADKIILDVDATLIDKEVNRCIQFS